MGVGVLHNGEYVVLTGNQSGSVEIEYICSQLQKQGKMPENPVMFNTVVTSDLGEKVASDYGVTTEKTLTGFKFIGEKVAKLIRGCLILLDSLIRTKISDKKMIIIFWLRCLQ